MLDLKKYVEDAARYVVREVEKLESQVDDRRKAGEQHLRDLAERVDELKRIESFFHDVSTLTPYSPGTALALVTSLFNEIKLVKNALGVPHLDSAVDEIEKLKRSKVPSNWRDHYRDLAAKERARAYQIVHAYEAYLLDLRSVGVLGAGASNSTVANLVRPFLDGTIDADGNITDTSEPSDPPVPAEPEYPHEQIIDTPLGQMSIWSDGPEPAGGRPLDRSMFGPHDYGEKNSGRCRHECQCWMGNFTSGGPVNPMGPCPKNPR